MKTVLVNPPWRKGKFYGVRAGSRWPFMQELMDGDKVPGYMPFPFFMAYAAALLEKNKKEVLLIDALAEGFSDNEFIEKAAGFNPDIIVMETSTPSFYTDLKWAERLKEKLPGARMVMCGTHASTYAEEILKKEKNIDFIMTGEYEFTLLELVSVLETGESLEGIKGLVYKKEGEQVRNGARPLVQDLNEFPWPARHFVPMLNYNDSFSGLPSPNVQVWASRGCPFECVFCIWPKIMYGGKAYRTRDYKDVVDEVEWLIKEYGFKAFYFDDDTFNIGRERIINLSREIKKRNLGVPWAIMARADTSDPDTFIEMKEAGLWAVKFGVESGVQEIVDKSGKNLDLKKVEKNVKLLKELGIKVHLTFTLGLPGDTKDTLKETIQYAKRLDPDSVQFSIVTPFPGTVYFDMLDKKGQIESKNWEEYDGNNRSVIRTDNFTSEELAEWCKKAVREWNAHQMKTRLLKHPLRSVINAVKKPYYTKIFLKNLFKK